MQEYKVQICRPWKNEWEDLGYGEEVELANIMCQQCVGFDAKAMNEKDFKTLADRCYSEIYRKIGAIKGRIPLPIYGNVEEYYLVCIAEKYPIGIVGSFACVARKNMLEFDAEISKTLVSQIDNPIITTYTLGEDTNES